jgi:hypothetical protein
VISANGIDPIMSGHQMSRNFSRLRAGNLCVEIKTFQDRTLSFNYELLNLSDNQVVKREQLLDGNRIEFSDLQAGNYQLTLRNISRTIEFAELCLGKVLFKHWVCVMK